VFARWRLRRLPPFFIAGVKYRNETTGVNDEILGNDVVLISDPSSSTEFEGIRTFQTFRAKMESGTGWVTREFHLPNQGLLGADYMVAGYSEADVTIANDAGGLIKAVTD
jgi:hypothetical protein